MANIRQYVPVTLLVWIVGLLILGAIAGPIIRSLATEEQLASNVILSAIPFVLVFAAIVLVYIALNVVASRVLDHKISRSLYYLIERITIAGIVLGAFGMFQPWWFFGYRLGFFVVLISTLAFILWTHVTPRGIVRHSEQLRSVSISQFEQSESAGR